MSDAVENPDLHDVLRTLLRQPDLEARRAISRLSQRDFQQLASRLLTVQQNQRRETQILYYRPVSDKAMEFHTCEEQTVAIGGGNRSGKTSTCLADMVMSTSGIWSIAVREALSEIDRARGQPEGTALRKRFRGPTSVRVVCESLTTTLHQTILPKLQWWKWTGIDAPGGDRGHWGWIPRDCLIGGSWERSWSEKLRTLRVLCRDPNDRARVVGESTWQFMSHDQDPTDFASGQFHAILHDEPPRYAIWRENEARAISVSGRLFVAMTWPDDPSIPVDWIFDRIYEPAQRGDSGVRWLNLWMTENPHIDQAAVESQRSKWDEQTVQVRVYGRPIRFSNRVHPLFTKESEWWCFDCGKSTLADLDEAGGEVCQRCRSSRVRDFSHVRDFEANPHWPTLFVLDPHPRKPHMFCWIQVDPGDDLWVVAEGECPGDPMTLREAVAETEENHHLEVRQRLIDPNMGRSPSSSIRREATWQDDFDAVGLVCDLADDGEVGRARVNEMLRPDPDTMAPRLHVHPRCHRLIRQMLRYVWDDYRSSLERDLKQRPKDKDDDYPTMLKYALNAAPSFRGLTGATGIVRRRETTARSRRVREAQWTVRT